MDHNVDHNFPEMHSKTNKETVIASKNQGTTTTANKTKQTPKQTNKNCNNTQTIQFVGFNTMTDSLHEMTEY